MKIAQIVCVFPPYAGGIGGSAWEFSCFLAGKKDVEVTVYTPAYNNKDILENIEGVKVRRLKPWLKYGNGAFLPQLLWELKDYDIIHLHYPFFGTAEVVSFFKLFFKKPKLILHYHMDVLGLSPLARLLSLPSKLMFKLLFKQASVVLCSSFDYIKTSQIKKYYYFEKEKFRELPFGVDLDVFKVNKELSNKDSFNILFVGGLDRAHYFKGVDILLRAVAMLPRDKNWRLIIVGDGDLRKEYEKQAASLGISERTVFFGKLDQKELVSAYQKAKVFVLPSINKNEAFGIVLLEAMACGVPVIASDLAGVRSVFENGREGFLTRPKDPKDLKNKIEFLLNNPLKQKQMASNARKLACEKYNKENIGKNLLKIYESVLNK